MLRVVIALLTCLLIAAIGGVAEAQAATYTVGTTGDPTGSCALTASTCSLRQLINDENALNPAPNPADTIMVPAGIYSLTEGQLTVRQSLTIAGAGAETTQIDQEDTQATARVFEIMGNPKINPDPTVVISGMAMAFGKADSTNGSQGGDVQNQANLTLSEDLIEDATASGTGGGVSNDGGTLTITHSLVWQNSSTAVVGTTVSGGIAGGVENYGDDTVGAGTLSIDNSTIAGNTAADLGGGVVSRCTGSGGQCSSSGANNTTTITNSTIADNNGGSGGVTGGGILASSGTIFIGSSIVAGNTVTNPTSGTQTPSNCGQGPAGVPNPGVLTSRGYSLETATDCGFTSTGDLQNTNPQFFNGGGLAFNGGNTETFALSMTSPAVDAVPKSVAACSGTDQRDIPRPQGSGCDMGAYELFQPVEGQQFTTVLGQIGATSATIDWADGSRFTSATVDSLGRVTGTHTYTEEGDYSGLIDWTNSDGTAQSTPFDLKVVDAPLTAAAVNFTAVAGSQFSGPVATFTDADPGGTASDYSATIVWGDGTQSAGTVSAGQNGGFVVSGTHTYATTGSYETTVSIADAGGSTAVVLGTATVNPPAPTVTQVSPSAGPTVGGNTITITGTNLASASAVKFGTGSATIKTNTATSITATAPAAGAGTVDVTVTTPGGTSTTSTADQYTYVAAPTVTNVSPTAGPTGGGNTVTITGTNLTGATAVNFGTNTGTIKTDTATSITATAPARSAGTIDITVTTTGGTGATGAADQYTYVAAPTVTNVSPVAGPTGGGNTVTVTGTNLTGATAVTFGTNTGMIKTDTATSITATAPAGGAGTVDITVTTAGGISATAAADKYTYTTGPAVTSVNPASGPLAGGTLVTITGANLAGATAVKFGTNTATIKTDAASSITATAPADSAGTVDITVTTAGGTSPTGTADQYTYVGVPTITGVSPSAGPASGGTVVIITGTLLSSPTAVKFGGTPATNITGNATRITATAPAGTPGTVDVTVATVGGTSATGAPDRYTYFAAPTVSSVSPGSGSTAGGTGVTITGANLNGASSVAFGSNPATNVAVVGPSEITATSPPGSAGAVDVTVTTPGGTSATSPADQYTYLAPAGPASPPPASSSPPVVAGASPTTTTSNGAAVSGTVNPESLVTTAFFEYGLDPSDRGPGASTTLYDQSTPPQQAGADTATHTITAPLTGLVPGALYHIRIVATNSAGTTLGPDVTFTTPASPAPAPPVLGKTQDAAPVTGTVFIKTPSGFVRLTGNEQIPSGAEIDALHGSLKITTATTKKGKTQQGTFGGAVFTLTQARGGATNGLATLSLVENAFSGAPSYATCKPHKALDATAASSKTLQLLHASAHGKFRTKGRYSAATVLGTKWTIADRCDGTLTHDITDSVQVNDFVHHKTIILHAGQSYLAKAKP